MINLGSHIKSSLSVAVTDFVSEPLYMFTTSSFHRHLFIVCATFSQPSVITPSHPSPSNSIIFPFHSSLSLSISTSSHPTLSQFIITLCHPLLIITPSPFTIKLHHHKIPSHFHQNKLSPTIPILPLLLHLNNPLLSILTFLLFTHHYYTPS